jgi:hypothetical protein
VSSPSPPPGPWPCTGACVGRRGVSLVLLGYGEGWYSWKEKGGVGGGVKSLASSSLCLSLSRDWEYLLRERVPCWCWGARGGVAAVLGAVACRLGDAVVEDVGGGLGSVLLRCLTCVWNWICC